MSSTQPDVACPHTLPTQNFYSVEYPGYVTESSIPVAIRNLGGQASVDNAFRRVRRNETRDNLVDLNFRPDNPFSHPVPGDVTSANKLLLKVVKRKRRRLNPPGDPTPAQRELEGEYTAEIIGKVPKTLRFRSMADFQYQPDPSDPIVKLRMAMESMDAQAIKDFKFGPEAEDYAEQELLDPVLFEDGEDIHIPGGIHQPYNFKQNPASLIETNLDELTGEVKKKYVNRAKWKSWSVVPLSFAEKEVPTKPFKQVEEMRSSANNLLFSRLQKCFEERPVWTRLALLNQFSPFEAREISNTKYLIPLFCYVFNDGPWRDTLVRLGYDPRTDISSRFYQRIYFRNVNNHTLRPSVTARVEAKYPDKNSMRSEDIEAESDRKAHIFDGKTQSSETASFQLCDIYDPMLKAMIENEDELRDECSDRDGWYESTQIEGIKTILRHKFFSLLEGHVATDAECKELLATNTQTRGYGPTYSRKLRKYNKAKGALPPEEEAAARLRKTLAQEKVD